MFESAKAVLKIIQNAGFESYFIGGKCRTELHNEYHDDNKLDIKDIDIVTNANIEQLQKIFPNSDDVGKAFQVLIIEFAGERFEIASYRQDIYYDKENNHLSNPITKCVKTLDEDRSRRDFSCNAIAQTINDDYIDYKWKQNGQTHSGIDDIKNGIIRAIGNPKDRFTDDPLRTLRAFRFMSQTGYKIEKETLKGIKSTMRFLRDVPGERVGQELRKIIAGRYCCQTLKLMKKIGIFNSKCLIDNDKCKILESFDSFDDEKFDSIEIYKDCENFELELWSILFENMPDDAYQSLKKFNSFNELELNTIIWLIKNRNIADNSTDTECRNAILSSITKKEEKLGIHYLKKLILKSNRIYMLQHSNSEEAKKKTQLLFFNLCARPYFINQLDISGEDMLKLTDTKPGKWIRNVKYKLLKKLIFSKSYPSQDEITTSLLISVMNDEGIKICESE